MSDWYWAQGDTSPITETLRDADQNPVDLQGATITLTATPIHGGTPIINAASVTRLQVGDGSDGSKGKVRFTPTNVQTGTPGDYLARFKATLLSGTVITFPNDGYILVTVTPAAATISARYVSAEEFKKTLELTGLSYADQDITDALTAASRGLEDVYNNSLPWSESVTTNEVRYYTRSTDRTVNLDDVLAITSVDLDYAWLDTWYYDSPDYYTTDRGPGTYDRNVATSDYRLLPIQNGLATAGGNGEPYKQLELVRGSTLLKLPSGTDAIRITGTYGWETTPAGVRVAVKILAARLLRRTREAPFGIVALGSEGAVIRARDISSDPDIRFAMQPLTGARKLFV